MTLKKRTLSLLTKIHSRITSALSTLESITTSHSKLVIISLTALFLFSATFAFASPRSSPYLTNETLDPTCAPTETNCYVANALSTGVTGGQTIIGGTDASDNLTLSSTANATKGKIIFGTSAYDEANNRLGIGTTSPTDGRLTIISTGDISDNTNLYNTYDAFGDSITVGHGASNYLTTAYIPLLIQDTGWSISNHAVSGSQVPDQAAAVYADTVTNNSVATYMLGTNDQDVYGIDANKLSIFKSGHEAEIAWLAIPNTDKVLGTSSSVAYTGTWTNTNAYHIGKNTAISGATATFSVTGENVLVEMIQGDQYVQGAYTISIDGVSQGNFTSIPAASMTTQNGAVYGPELLVFKGLTNSAHTIVITATDTNGVYFDWAAGISSTTTYTPTVYVANIPYGNNYGYWGGSSANVDSYNAAIASNVSELAGMGLNVKLVDDNSVVDPTTDLSSDGLHPNDAGHRAIANAFENVIGISLGTVANTMSIKSSTGSSQFTISSGGFVGIGIATPNTPFSIQVPLSAFDVASGGNPLLPLATYYSSGGLKTLETRVTPYNSLALGVNAGNYLTTGANNNFLGYNSGYSNTTGASNDFLGYQSGYSNTTGSGDNFLGYDTGYSNTTGVYNNFLGYNTGYFNTTGFNNNFLGYQSGYSNTTGYKNNFLGYNSGYSNTIGNSNNFFGDQSGYANTTGSNNNFLGNGSGHTNTTGSNNNFLGNGSGHTNTTGANNNFFGSNAGYSNTTAIGNNFLGSNSGYSNTTGTGNNFLGSNAGYANTTGSNNNFFGGNGPGYFNTTGSNNNFFGYQSGYGVSVSSNVSGDIFMGYKSGFSILTGGNNNTFLGFQSGYSDTTGANNIILGSYVDVPSATTSGQLNIGNVLYGTGLYTTASNSSTPTTTGKIGIGNSAPSYILHVGQSSTPSGIVARFQNTSGTCDVNPTLGAGGFACSSDMTLKKNITDIGDNTTWSFNNNLDPSSNTVLDKILTLTPVMYNWNTELDTDPKHAGFIAQQVQQIFPDLVSTDPTTHLLSLNYTGLVPYTVAAIKEMNIQLQAIPQESDQTFYQKIADFLRGIAEQGTAVVDYVTAKKVTGDQLCAGTVCVDQTQLQNMINYINNHPDTSVTTTPTITTTDNTSSDSSNSSDTPTSSDQTQTTSDNSSSTDTQTATDQTTTSDTTPTTVTDTTDDTTSTTQTTSDSTTSPTSDSTVSSDTTTPTDQTTTTSQSTTTDSSASAPSDTSTSS
jgi:lysophospholipase L1-like esterase